MARLTEQLEKQGWTWKEDELAAAFGRPKRGLGWNESTPTRGAEQQFVWQARWKNASGDELSYDLTQFAVPPAGQKASAPDSGLLEVRASLLTRTQLGRP